MKKTIFVANWKMNLGVEQSKKLAEEIVQSLTSFGGDVILCPSHPALATVRAVLPVKSIFSLGAQNMYSEDTGAYTGEVSAAMLKEVGCTHVIVGHSERRQYFNETNDDVRAKVKAAVRHGLIPILCVGETIVQRNNGSGQVIIREQLMTALEGVDLPELIVAYEPVWAIGTGHAATSEDAGEVRDLIKEIVANFLPNTAVTILYGGSVDATNVSTFTEASGLSGVLVGSASLTAPEVKAMCDQLTRR